MYKWRMTLVSSLCFLLTSACDLPSTFLYPEATRQGRFIHIYSPDSNCFSSLDLLTSDIATLRESISSYEALFAQIDALADQALVIAGEAAAEAAASGASSIVISPNNSQLLSNANDNINVDDNIDVNNDLDVNVINDNDGILINPASSVSITIAVDESPG